MEASHSFLIADRARFEALLNGLARRLYAELGGDVVLVGIRRRGAPLAVSLAGRLVRLAGQPIEVGELELKRYADDLTVLHERPALGAVSLPDAVRGGTVVLVDDVLYTGRSMLRAVEQVVEAGAARVCAAVLCTRDAPAVPVAATFAGLRLDVGAGGIIEVHVPPYEEVPGIVLRPRPAA
jgi:pyrimidine operon attenuation protein/uracil phosphoribosyltransferase